MLKTTLTICMQFIEYKCMYKDCVWYEEECNIKYTNLHI